MKRFLPTIPAFLLCLFGGMAFGPKPGNSAGVAAAVSQWPGKVDGYEKWKEDHKDDSTIALKKTELTTTKNTLDSLATALPNYESKFTSLSTKLGVEKSRLDKILQDPAKSKEMEILKKKMDDAHEGVKALGTRYEKESETMKFKDRIDWKRDYDKALGEFTTAQGEYNEALKTKKQT
jgi:hypothetical protein